MISKKRMLDYIVYSWAGMFITMLTWTHFGSHNWPAFWAGIIWASLVPVVIFYLVATDDSDQAR